MNKKKKPSGSKPPQPLYEKMMQERDVMVPMRDGVHVCVDVYRPEASGRFPAILAFAVHNKDLQTPDIAEAIPPQPAWSPLWQGGMEAGDTKYLVSRGYVHVIGNPRGVGKSEDGGSPEWDTYDLIEWIAKQPWCDGNIGMIGISAFAGMQWRVALQQPPHLKAIFPYDACNAYGDIFGFRDLYPGGVLHPFTYLIDQLGVIHGAKGRPGKLPPQVEKRWKEAMNNPDYKIYSNMYNVLTMKGQHSPLVFDALIDPFDKEEIVKAAEENFKKIKIPVYTGAGWYAYTYKMHLQGAQHWYSAVKAPKKMLFNGPAHLERPFHSFHDEIVKWYDYWLKGTDNGIMKEPSVKYWVMGENKWRYGKDWPLPETKWTKYYLHSWERMRIESFTPSGRDGYDEPDAFVQMPPTHTRRIEQLRYMTDPLPEDTLIAGPAVLYLYASMDQKDTNWIVILKDVGPDVSVRTAREGETEVPANLPERELTRGWLKASHRALDPKRSKPWKPWHPHTRKAWRPVVPGEINEYAIEILSTANLFEKGHRICLDITSLDLPTGTACATNVEYIPYHICSSKTVLHKIYHNGKYPSHLLLPIIPKE
jgi:predicted acyl esterase